MKSFRLFLLTIVLLHVLVAAESSFFTFSSSFLSAQNVVKGLASYYSRYSAGRMTASGEVFSHDSMTCAHRTYPFGTILQIKNPANGRVVVVRVNDRGPFVRNRIVDLSWGAARELGILVQGVAMVEIETLEVFQIPMQYHEKIVIPRIYDDIETKEFPWRPIGQDF